MGVAFDVVTSDGTKVYPGSGVTQVSLCLMASVEEHVEPLPVWFGDTGWRFFEDMQGPSPPTHTQSVTHTSVYPNSQQQRVPDPWQPI